MPVASSLAKNKPKNLFAESSHTTPTASFIQEEIWFFEDSPTYKQPHHDVGIPHDPIIPIEFWEKHEDNFLRFIR